jgi:hypothetical protein
VVWIKVCQSNLIEKFVKKFLGFVFSRAPWLFFFATKGGIGILKLFPGFYKRSLIAAPLGRCLAIEAGEKGWDSIEFKELFISASEYLGDGNVRRLVIDKNASYVAQVETALRGIKATHYLYDPRTGSQVFHKAFWDAFRIALLLARYRIVPIVYITDISLRMHRCLAAVMSALDGIVVNFILPEKIQSIFPHNRIIGPSLMPMSLRTLDALKELKRELVQRNEVSSVVRFCGSLYEPRTSFLLRLREQLAISNYELEIQGRGPGIARMSDALYWKGLCSASIVVTTAEQNSDLNSSPCADFSHVPQLVYRYLETLASGSLLLAPSVPGVQKYFVPGEHFVDFTSLDEAVDKALYYLRNIAEAENIRTRGHERAADLIRSRVFWLQIDTALGKSSFDL